jgi:hypothetical protein
MEIQVGLQELGLGVRVGVRNLGDMLLTFSIIPSQVHSVGSLG